MSSELYSTRLPLLSAVVTGALITALAAVVLVGWLTHTLFLVQVLPGASAMRFNTAACLFFLGIACVAIGRRRVWVPRVLGSAIAAFAAATMSQDLLGINLGIDNLLFSDGSGVGPNPSGRMAINTAVCFVLSGVSPSYAAGTYFRLFWGWNDM